MGRFDSAAAVYACQRRATIARHEVTHADFRQYCKLLKHLERDAASSGEDAIWVSFLKHLKRFRFRLLATSAPFGHPAVLDDAAEGELTSLARHAGHLYPGQALVCQQLVDCLKALRRRNEENPILTRLREIALPADVAIAVADTRLRAVVEQTLRNTQLRQVQVVTPSSLRADSVYVQLVTVGPARWFPAFVFDARRAERIDIVHFEWVRDSAPQSRGFVAPQRHVVVEVPHQREAESYLDADDSAAFSWIAAAERATAGRVTALPSEEVTDACLFLLDGGRAVFLESGDEASVLAINLEEMRHRRVSRVVTSQIEPGMFLLLRTEGGGDYVTEVADKILGPSRDEYRNLQAEWKAKLRTFVKSKGVTATCRELTRAGSTRATPMNLRNWQSRRNIKTEDIGDFAAILQMIGLSDTLTPLWRAMERIDTAHKRAGQQIRRQLLRLVAAADIARLQQQGHHEFRLDPEHGGSITAFRVEAISPRTTRVAVNRLSEVLDVPD